MDAKKSAEAELHEAFAEWAETLESRDAEALLKDYQSDVLTFDIGGTYAGKASLKTLWEQCFPYFKETIGVHQKNIRITVNGDMAVMYGYTRMTGHGSDDPLAKSWIRMTICYEKVDGRWTVFHEHMSYAINCMDKTIVLDTASAE